MLPLVISYRIREAENGEKKIEMEIRLYENLYFYNGESSPYINV